MAVSIEIAAIHVASRGRNQNFHVRNQTCNMKVQFLAVPPYDHNAFRARGMYPNPNNEPVPPMLGVLVAREKTIALWNTIVCGCVSSSHLLSERPEVCSSGEYRNTFALVMRWEDGANSY